MLIGFICIILAAAAALVMIVAKAQSKHDFACANCGNTFQPKWTQLVFEVHAFDAHRLKCPFCKRTTLCKDIGKQA